MPPSPSPIDVADVLDTREYYGRIQLWPQIPTAARPRQWLHNFLPDELRVATALLDGFIFYNARMTDRLFVSSFHNLSRDALTAGSYVDCQRQWVRFLDQVLITHPTDEPPSVTDSGHLFDRKARQLLGIDESRILSPGQALDVLLQGGPRPVVFVDDFAGSGLQFTDTWRRDYTIRGAQESFESLAARGDLGDVYYCAAVCTAYAEREILSAAPSLRIRPAHLLPDEYGAAHPQSLLFPSDLLCDVESVILSASSRAGVQTGREFGWHRLGLAIAFEHSVPDASLPLFYAEAPGWNPLLRRR